MKIPVTLSKYIAKQFFVSFIIVFTIIALIIALFDTLELFRRMQGKDIPSDIIMAIVALKMPYLLQQLLPFIVLIATLLTFTKLTKSLELVVARAAGVSVWQFLFPAVVITLLIGVVNITSVNPLSAVMLNKLDFMEAKYFSGNVNTFSISSTGLWLKQEDKVKKEKIIIHALRTSDESSKLYDVTFYIFGITGNLENRIFTKEAELKEQYWFLKDGIIFNPDKNEEKIIIRDYKIPTTLKIQQIQNSFFPPENISFWNLADFIATLKSAGFSASRHILYWHKTITEPLLLTAMVFFAAIFSLRLYRKGRTGVMLAYGLLLGFAVKFLSDIVAAFALSGDIPPLVATWGPIIIITFASISLLLHLEDG